MPLYEEHEKRHGMWEARDLDFLEQFPEKELSEVLSFMTDYNTYLQQQIDSLTEETR